MSTTNSPLLTSYDMQGPCQFFTDTGTAFGITQYGTGNGTLSAAGGVYSVFENYTVTATSSDTFTVFGSSSGNLGTLTVGTEFLSATVTLSIVAGNIDFVPGDYFTFSTAPRTCITPVALPVSPNWNETVTESITYKTSVITSYNGVEQRSRLMSEPTITFEYTVVATDTDEVYLMEDVVHYKQNDLVFVPIWQDAMPILSADSLSIQCLTANTRLKDDGYALVYRSSTDYVIVAIASVSSSGITLKIDIDPAAAVNAVLYPVAACFISDTVRFENSYGYSAATIEFTVAK